MKRTAALVVAGALAFAGGVVARATSPANVNQAAVASGMPAMLSEYRFFADAAPQLPGSAVVPYRLNTPLYSDGAEKLRFVYVPPGAKLSANGDGLLDFPTGSALIKTFAFGEGSARRLIETRVLLHRAEGWVALPYLWNEAQTDAKLALAGARIELVTPRGEAISYKVPNKNQCKECHGLDGAVVPIGPKARNLSAAWLQSVLGAAPQGADTLPVWEKRTSVTQAAAARAYLDVNCAHCHRPGATASNSGLDLRWEQHDPEAIGVGKRPVAAGRGAGDLSFDIEPGNPAASIVVHRMKSLDPGVAMPEIGKSTVDHEGVAAVEAWIAGL